MQHVYYTSCSGIPTTSDLNVMVTFHVWTWQARPDLHKVVLLSVLIALHGPRTVLALH